MSDIASLTASSHTADSQTAEPPQSLLLRALICQTAAQPRLGCAVCNEQHTLCKCLYLQQLLRSSAQWQLLSAAISQLENGPAAVQRVFTGGLTPGVGGASGVQLLFEQFVEPLAAGQMPCDQLQPTSEEQARIRHAAAQV